MTFSYLMYAFTNHYHSFNVISLVFFWPFFPARWPNDRRHSLLEEIPGSAQVDDVEDHPLVFLDVVHSEVEPEPDPGVAGVGTDEEVVFVFGDEVNSTEIAYLKIFNWKKNTLYVIIHDFIFWLIWSNKVILEIVNVWLMFTVWLCAKVKRLLRLPHWKYPKWV